MPARKATDKVLQRFGASLRRERVAREMTQEQLAELAELNVRTVQKIEAGQTNILVTTLVRIQTAVGCDWNRLMPHG